jgi:hypothetical protein
MHKVGDIADELFGTGFLRDEQRAEIRKFSSRYGILFTSRRDLGGVITITLPQGMSKDVNPTLIASATAEFIGNFTAWTLKRLNGFSGFDCLRFEIKNNS